MRVAIRQYLITVVAVYNGAIPVVEKTRDAEVVRNIFDDLPMQYAFLAGDTDLFAGLKEAARIAHPWRSPQRYFVVGERRRHRRLDRHAAHAGIDRAYLGSRRW